MILALIKVEAVDLHQLKKEEAGNLNRLMLMEMAILMIIKMAGEVRYQNLMSEVEGQWLIPNKKEEVEV